MSSNRLLKAFTLVELLVVIGIIAVLISVLMPALVKARQEGNLISCGSNLRQIEGLLSVYSSENRGWMPYGYAQVYRLGPTDFGNGWWNTPTWQWADTLSLLSNNRTQGQGGTWNARASSWNSKNEQNMAYDYPGIFHDTDTAVLPYGQRVSDFTGNLRCLPDDTMVDPWDATAHHTMPLRQIGSIKRPAEVMMIWCGADNISDGKTNQGADALDWQIDVSAAANNGGWGYGSCFPGAPPGSGYKAYANRIALGNDGNHWSGANNVTLAALRRQNIDDQNPVWNNACDMRFRHLGNTAASVLFADGHVEARQLGDVRAMDISLNAITPFGIAPAGWALPQ